MRLAIEVSRSAVVPEPRRGEVVLAVEVGLAHRHRVLAHLDLVGVAEIGGLQIGEFDLGRVELALGERERDLVGLADRCRTADRRP